MDSVGQWIKQTRRTKGFSLKQLAEAIGPKVTIQTLTNFENGRELPSPSILAALGNALDVSTAVFKYSLVIDIHILEYRKPAQVTAKECVRAEMAFQSLLERYLTIEQILELPTPVSWREKLCPARLESWEDLEERAESLRSIWQLGTEPIPSMCELLEENGIKILEQDVPQYMNGLACQARVLNIGVRVVDAVLVSSKVNVERKRFTLAHELAHQIIPSTGDPELPLKTARDWFAAAFLVPKQALIQDTNSSDRALTSSEILSLKRKYGVPASCILKRLEQVGILSTTAVEDAFQTFARSWLDSEPDPMLNTEGFAMLEHPIRLERLVSCALSDGHISSDRAAYLLGKSRSHVE